MTRYLYDDTDLRIDGDITPEGEAVLKDTYRRIGAATNNAMRKVGLYATGTGTEVISTDYIPAEDGLIGGYTDGNVVGINQGMIPGTRHYGKFKEWVHRQQGRLGRYLYDKFGTDDSAIEALRYTSGHEKLHKSTQLNPMKTADGKVTPVFAKELLKTLTERYESGLPKWAKWLAPLMARSTYVPLIEGLNEVTTENVMNGETTYTVRQKRATGPTTYDKFAAAAADSLYRIGVEERMDGNYSGMDFYSDWADNPGKFTNRYIDGFFSASGKYCGSGCHMMEMSAPAAYCAKAA